MILMRRGCFCGAMATFQSIAIGVLQNRMILVEKIVPKVDCATQLSAAQIKAILRRENELRFLWGSEGYENKEAQMPLQYLPAQPSR